VVVRTKPAIARTRSRLPSGHRPTHCRLQLAAPPRRAPHRLAAWQHAHRRWLIDELRPHRLPALGLPRGRPPVTTAPRRSPLAALALRGDALGRQYRSRLAQRGRRQPAGDPSQIG